MFCHSRYPEPEEWLRIVKEELGLQHVQFSFDLLDPVIDEEIVKEKCAFIRRLADEGEVKIDTAVTGEAGHKFNLLLDLTRVCVVRICGGMKKRRLLF